MTIQTLIELLRTPHKRAQLAANQLVTAQSRLLFLRTALDLGLFAAMRTPSRPDELIRALGVRDRALLASLLDLGCALKELSLRGDRYRLRSPLAWALTDETPTAGILRELTSYHADMAPHLAAFIREGSRGEYLAHLGGVFALSSRMAEPFIRAFIGRTVKSSKPLRILEIGCGAGEYLACYTDINPLNGGMAIDIDAQAAAMSGEAVARRGLADRFTVRHGDILAPGVLTDERFDLVTSYSNIYYFSAEDRSRLYSSVRQKLNDGGRFMLASMFRGDTVMSRSFDMVFSATRGLYPLLPIEAIAAEISAAGFNRVESVMLYGPGSFGGIVAHR